MPGQCDDLMRGRLTDAITFARVLRPDIDTAKVPLAFNTEFCSTLCQQIRSYGLVGGPAPPKITKCVAAHDTLMLHMMVDQDLLEIQVQSRPVATEDNRNIVPDPKRWAMSDSDEIPGMQVRPLFRVPCAGLCPRLMCCLSGAGIQHYGLCGAGTHSQAGRPRAGLRSRVPH